MADAVRYLKHEDDATTRAMYLALDRGEAVADALELMDDDDLSRDSYRLSDWGNAGSAAIQAMHSVCWAEHLAATEKDRERLLRLSQDLRNMAAESERAAEAKAREKISLNAQIAAIKRHAENRAMKSEAMAWYEAHRHEYRSKEKAAEAIAGSVVPVTIRTVRDWITEYDRERNLRSARKA